MGKRRKKPHRKHNTNMLNTFQCLTIHRNGLLTVDYCSKCGCAYQLSSYLFTQCLDLIVFFSHHLPSSSSKWFTTLLCISDGISYQNYQTEPPVSLPFNLIYVCDVIKLQHSLIIGCRAECIEDIQMNSCFVLIIRWSLKKKKLIAVKQEIKLLMCVI